MSPAVVQRLPMVGLAPRSREVQTAPQAESNRVQTLDIEAAVERGRLAAGLTHGQMCAYMSDEDGKPLDQSLWTRMRRDGNLPIKRMRNLPIAFWHGFVGALGEAADMQCSHADIADIAVMRVAVAFEAVADAFRHMQRRTA